MRSRLERPEQLPLTRDAFQRVGPSILEVQTGARREVADRRGDEYFAGRRRAGDPRGRMDRDATDRGPRSFHLTAMHADPDVEAELAIALGDTEAETDGASRTVECGKEPIPRGVDLPTVGTCERVPHHPVMRVEKLAPATIAESGRTLGRARDVEEQHGGEESIRSHGGARASRELFVRTPDRLAVELEP